MTYRIHYTHRGQRRYIDMETRADALAFLAWGQAAGIFLDPRIETHGTESRQ